MTAPFSTSVRILTSMDVSESDLTSLDQEILLLEEQLDILRALKKVSAVAAGGNSLVIGIEIPKISSITTLPIPKPTPPEPKPLPNPRKPGKPLPSTKPKSPKLEIDPFADIPLEPQDTSTLKPTNGKTGRCSRMLERREKAVRYIASHGPQRVLELAKAIGVPDGTISAVVNYKWFDREAGKVIVTSIGHQEVIGKEMQEKERDL